MYGLVQDPGQLQGQEFLYPWELVLKDKKSRPKHQGRHLLTSFQRYTDIRGFS